MAKHLTSFYYLAGLTHGIPAHKPGCTEGPSEGLPPEVKRALWPVSGNTHSTYIYLLVASAWDTSCQSFVHSWSSLCANQIDRAYMHIYDSNVYPLWTFLSGWDTLQPTKLAEKATRPINRYFQLVSGEKPEAKGQICDNASLIASQHPSRTKLPSHREPKVIYLIVQLSREDHPNPPISHIW